MTQRQEASTSQTREYDRQRDERVDADYAEAERAEIDRQHALELASGKTALKSVVDQTVWHIDQVLAA